MKVLFILIALLVSTNLWAQFSRSQDWRPPNWEGYYRCISGFRDEVWQTLSTREQKCAKKYNINLSQGPTKLIRFAFLSCRVNDDETSSEKDCDIAKVLDKEPPDISTANSSNSILRYIAQAYLRPPQPIGPSKEGESPTAQHSPKKDCCLAARVGF